MTYRIVGGDGREYGPVEAETIRQWIREGRANGQSCIKPDGESQWRALDSVPDFLEALRDGGVSAPLGAEAASPIQPKTAPAIEGGGPRGGAFSVREALARGWALFQEYPGLLIGSMVVVIVAIGTLALLSNIRGIGNAFWLLGQALLGPILGGIFRLLLKLHRGQNAEFADALSGFTHDFVPLLAAGLVPGLLATLIAAPGLGLWFVGRQVGGSAGAVMTLTGSGIWIAVTAVCAVIWTFVLPLVADRGTDFWSALRISRRAVCGQWIRVVLLLLASAAINFAGALLCGVGLLVTLPVTSMALMVAYERVCRDV